MFQSRRGPAEYRDGVGGEAASSQQRVVNVARVVPAALLHVLQPVRQV